MVAIEHRPQTSTSTLTTTITAVVEEVTTPNTSNNNNNNNNLTTTTVSVLSPTSSATSSSSSSATTTTTSSVQHPPQPQQPLKESSQKRAQTKKLLLNTNKMSTESAELAKRHQEAAAAAIAKSAVSQRNDDIKVAKSTDANVATQELTKKVLTLDLTGKELDDFSLKSPKSPITARLPHQASLTSSVDVEDRKTLREALYQGIFHRHRRTIFAVGSFLRMLRSRNSQYNTIRSSSEGEGEEVEEVR